MKISMIFVMLLAFLSPASFAESMGSAYIPYNLSATSKASEMGVTISNITDETVSVELEMYDLNGSLISSPSAFTNLNGVAINISTSPADATISFDIPANATAAFTYGNWNGHGYGKITWKQDSNRRTALLAHALRNNNGSFSIPVNAGLPF